MNAILKATAALATGLVAAVGAAPVFAAVNPDIALDNSIKAVISADVPSMSDLANIEAQEDADQAQIDALTSTTASASCGWDCVDAKLKALGDKMTTRRIHALNIEKDYIQQKKNISDSDRAELLAKLNTNIYEMTTLKTKIDGDTKHSDLVADVESITIDYREFMLVIPQVALMGADAHKEYAYIQLSADAVALQQKINNLSDEQKKAEAQAKLDDMKAKLADAKSNADAAYAEIVNLVPDQGNADVRKANKAALDDADAKISAAHQDYVAARADEAAINAILNGQSSSTGGRTIMKVSPGTPVSSTQGIARPIVPVHPIANKGTKVSPKTPIVSTHASVSATAAIR